MVYAWQNWPNFYQSYLIICTLYGNCEFTINQICYHFTDQTNANPTTKCDHRISETNRKIKTEATAAAATADLHQMFKTAGCCIGQQLHRIRWQQRPDRPVCAGPEFVGSQVRPPLPDVRGCFSGLGGFRGLRVSRHRPLQLWGIRNSGRILAMAVNIFFRFDFCLNRNRSNKGCLWVEPDIEVLQIRRGFILQL